MNIYIYKLFTSKFENYLKLLYVDLCTHRRFYNYPQARLATFWYSMRGLTILISMIAVRKQQNERGNVELKNSIHE